MKSVVVINKFSASCISQTPNRIGIDGHSPYVGDNNNWWEWNNETLAFEDTGINAEGEDGKDAYQSYLDTTSDDPPLTEGAWADLRLANIDGGTFN